MARYVWRQTNLITIIAVLAIMVTGCAPSRQEQVQTRLERFTTILPEQARRDFDAKRYEEVVRRVDSALAADPGFTARWNEVKKGEATGLFTTTEVVHYFVVYFVNYRGEG
ncbi:MAG: hypothetical protein PHR28_13235 [candidate division Zixibacteria bacterium]|nr:hypothetical protein [candidate division Zixibacteria bacterium]